MSVAWQFVVSIYSKTSPKYIRNKNNSLDANFRQNYHYCASTVDPKSRRLFLVQMILFLDIYAARTKRNIGHGEFVDGTGRFWEYVWSTFFNPMSPAPLNESYMIIIIYAFFYFLMVNRLSSCNDRFAVYTSGQVSDYANSEVTADWALKKRSCDRPI